VADNAEEEGFTPVTGPSSGSGNGRRPKPSTITGDEALAMVDDFFRRHGLDPAEAIDEEGWRRLRFGAAGGAVGVMKWPSGEDHLVVFAPILDLDPGAEGLVPFYRLLLELNHDGTEAARLSLKEGVLFLSYSRPIQGLSAGEVDYAINTVMRAADHYGERLTESLAIILQSAPLPLAELPKIKMTPGDTEKMRELLAACDAHGREVFRYLVERWTKAGHEVSLGKFSAGLDSRAGGKSWNLAGLKPVGGDRRQLIVVGWEGLRRLKALPPQAVDRFQESVRRIAEPHVQQSTAHIWVHEDFGKEQARALVRALSTLAESIGPAPAEVEVPAWDPQLPKLEIAAGRGTVTGIQDTLLACEPRVRELYALLVQGWHDAGGTVDCSRPGRIYLRLRARGHQFNLAVPAAPKGRRGPAIDLAWGLATSQYGCYQANIPEDVARWEAAASGLPGFKQSGAITRLVVGAEFGMEQAQALLDAMLALKAASEQAG